MKTSRRLGVDAQSGYSSDGTNMWDWSIDRLENCVNTCWYSDIVEKAKEILTAKKEQIERATA